jgi:hypothetical protein
VLVLGPRPGQPVLHVPVASDRGCPINWKKGKGQPRPTAQSGLLLCLYRPPACCIACSVVRMAVSSPTWEQDLIAMQGHSHGDWPLQSHICNTVLVVRPLSSTRAASHGPMLRVSGTSTAGQRYSHEFCPEAREVTAAIVSWSRGPPRSVACPPVGSRFWSRTFHRSVAAGWLACQWPGRVQALPSTELTRPLESQRPCSFGQAPARAALQSHKQHTVTFSKRGLYSVSRGRGVAGFPCGQRCRTHAAGEKS